MGAISAHSTATSTATWDGPANEARLPSQRGPLRAAHAWVDSGADPDTKAAYRFIHHFVSAGGVVGAASTVACSAGIAVLNGGRGGTTIPTGDRAGVYEHLARHLRDADLEPPPLRSAADTYEWRDDMMEPERRFTDVLVEVRAGDSGKRVGGYAAKFNRFSDNLGGFVERIASNFFNKSRGDGWPGVIARYNHDDNMLLGTSDSGTLSLRIDDVGLYYEVTPPTSRADVLELVQRGDVRRSSFAFRLPSGGEGEEWGLSDQGYPMRTLVTGRLVDVAPVNTPAYPDTSAAIRSLAAFKEAEVEEIRSLAVKDELRKLFAVTGGPNPKPRAIKPRLFGPAAAAALMARKEDPYA